MAVTKKKKFGSTKYPIRLAPHISEKEKYKRKFINKEYIRFPHEGGTILDFDKLPTVLGISFVENVVSNPHLSVLEMKLALVLSFTIFGPSEGILCKFDETICTKDIARKIGEDGSLYYGYEPDACLTIDNMIDLKAKLLESNISASYENIISSLYNLHEFSYITLTEVCWRNIHQKAPKKPNGLSMNDLNHIYCLSIRLFPYMESRQVFKYWTKLRS